ncbi:hypothetical protein [Thermococcus sp. JCM 11816]|uniref:hypothetical protein n=1 Tax=Thermococcus sp. (strain JCM 11816 / KS-1) TaxID=1295125 RepID=UPI0006CFDB11
MHAASPDFLDLAHLEEPEFSEVLHPVGKLLRENIGVIGTPPADEAKSLKSLDNAEVEVMLLRWEEFLVLIPPPMRPFFLMYSTISSAIFLASSLSKTTSKTSRGWTRTGILMVTTSGRRLFLGILTPPQLLTATGLKLSLKV